jgi:hypothetical protein
VSSVLFIYPADKPDGIKMLFMAAVRKIQPDYIQTGCEHFPQDSVIAGGRA